jgi:hypothetical protein
MIVKGPSGTATHGKIRMGATLQMDELTDIMDSLSIENDVDMKKIIINGKLYYLSNTRIRFLIY